MPYYIYARQTHRVGKSVIEVAKDFAGEKTCHDYLEAARWPKGVRCLQCGSDRISKYTAKGKIRIVKDKETGKRLTKTGPDRYLYQCMEQTCKFQFSTTVGTLFNDTHLPLNKWFMAIAIMCNAKKGTSAKQIERDLDISYKTAWYLNHRIRKAMDEGVGGLFTGTVEADETYIGGKFDKRRKRAKYDKEPVFGMVERDGKARTYHVSPVNRYNLISKIKDNISIEADLVCTDERFWLRCLPWR